MTFRYPRVFSISLLAAIALTGCAKDESPPVITLNGDATITVEFGDAFEDPGVTVTDDVDEDLEADRSGEVDTSTLGSYTLTYTAIDEAGNEADPVTRTVEVVDTTAPVISLEGDASVSVAEGTAWEDPGATATDNVDGELDVTVTGEVDTEVVGTYTLTYGATDNQGNAADPVNRTVEVTFEGSELFVVGSGAELELISVRPDGSIVQRASTTLRADALEGYNPNHSIFSVTTDPVSGDLYVSSFNDCWGGDDLDGCWGNARIDRYSYTLSELTHEGVAWLAQLPLRVLQPTLDSGAGTLTGQLYNHGDSAITISTVDAFELSAGVTFTSSCDGVTLAAGDTCELTWAGLPEAPTEISRFVVNSTGVAYRGRVDGGGDKYWMTGLEASWDGEAPAMPRCMNDNFEEPGQNGGCALTALAFAPDGQRMIVNEDRNDQLVVLTRNSDGTLAFASQASSRVYYHGAAVHPDGNAAYNGSAAFRIEEDDTLTLTTEGARGGNNSEVMEIGGVLMLLTTIQNEELSILSLADDALNPTPVATYTPSFEETRAQHHDATGSRFVVVGFGDLATVSFDGSSLTELATLNIPLTEDPCAGCEVEAFSRNVQMSPDGGFALVGTFLKAPEDEQGDPVPLDYRGLVRSYRIDAASGAITEADSLTLPGMTRAVKHLPVPE